jgi:RNA polymerase sigma factor (sigma-70 family)
VEGRPLEDAELVDRASQGDVSAYEELVRRHQRVAVRVAYLAGGSAAEAEDAAQEAFVKAFRALPRFRSGAPFRPWLLAIVANEARNRRRASQRRGRLAALLAARGGEDRPEDDAAPSPEAAVLAGEERQALMRALSTMRLEDRLVIAYRYFLELPEAETAAALGCPRGTVKSRLSRALGRLRIVLRDDAGGAAGEGGPDV